MSEFNRRSFLKIIGSSVAFAAMPGFVRAAAPLKVAVVGGGFGGAAAAKYLKMWGGAGVDVTLFDKGDYHTSCILSNLVLNGRLSLSSLQLKYDLLQQRGVKFVKANITAGGISQTGSTFNINGLSFDKVILAPGIGFEAIPFLNGTTTQKNSVLHAWIAGSQTTSLKSQLKNMPSDGTFVLVIPPAPYRCPPGPYERACVVADYLKRLKPNARIVVLDGNKDIVAEKHTFTNAFSKLYGTNLKRYASCVINNVSFPNTTNLAKINVTYKEYDLSGTMINTVTKTFKANVLNYLPVMRAGDLVHQAFGGQLVAGSSGNRWAPINPLTYESKNFPGIYVIGDSQGTGQPKSGHMANAQAKICADGIFRSAADPSYSALSDMDRTENVTTNSACYSPISYDQASWLTAVYRYDNDEFSSTYQSMKLAEYRNSAGDVITHKDGNKTALGEAASWSKDNYEEMFKWANSLFSDSFK